MQRLFVYCTDGSTGDPCGKPLGSGELIIDPRFVNIDNGDYRLSSKSPAINNGINLGYSIDLDKVQIGKNQIPDIGAYEKMNNQN